MTTIFSKMRIINKKIYFLKNLNIQLVFDFIKIILLLILVKKAFFFFSQLSFNLILLKIKVIINKFFLNGSLAAFPLHPHPLLVLILFYICWITWITQP